MRRCLWPVVARHPAQTLETRGLIVIVDQNQFSPIFFDCKNAGIQIVLHGDRIATDGAVKLHEQLRKPDVSAELHMYADSDHAFNLDKSSPFRSCTGPTG